MGTNFFLVITVNAITQAITPYNDRYPIFWNSDETHEPKVNVSEFNIITKNYTQCGDVCSNQQQNCKSWTQGVWPIITSSWQIINGGVPQAGNLSLHLDNTVIRCVRFFVTQ